MHMLFSLSRPSSPSRRIVRPIVEALERRDCPAAPTITSFTVMPMQGRMVSVSGTFSDEDPSSVTITLGGKLSGTANVMGGGTNSFWYMGEASGLGTITAVATDNENLSSEPASATLSSNVPSLTLNISYGARRQISLSGTINDESPNNCTVTINGKVSATLTNPGSPFMWMGEASGLGTITATVTDPWGQVSQEVQVEVTSNAPVIQQFTAEQGLGGFWTFRGKVVDESPAGLSIFLGGLPTLRSAPVVTVDADGWFSYTVQLTSEDMGGTATAYVQDWWGQGSNTPEILF
jgi:hypothetical protein